MSEIKVNKISPRSGTTVTLGDSGDTFTIPSGATINNQGTATNFGATGAASWNTTVKTTTFTAVAGEGYFVDTNGGAITVNLPAGTAGAVVAVKDYRNTFSTNNCTIDANGSDKIGGFTNDVVLSTDGIAITLIFIDSTRGWLVTDDGLQSSAENNPFVVATGGTVSFDGNDKIHTFTGPGTFCVSKTADCAADNVVDYLVVAGGGAGGHNCTGFNSGGGGGAGGMRFSATTYTSPSPLKAPTGVTVTATSFPITVGAGGGGAASPCSAKGASGSNSIFSTITSAGGGGGGSTAGCGPVGQGVNGGSGGGGTGSSGAGNSGGTGNTPSVSPAQGKDGGDGGAHPKRQAGGGGGFTAAGTCASNCGSTPGNGGAGLAIGITGSCVARAGGGGGGAGPAGSDGTAGTGGTGGGGAGANNNQPIGNGNGVDATSGTVNTGGGGGGSNAGGSGGSGGSGIVIIRYKFQ